MNQSIPIAPPDSSPALRWVVFLLPLVLLASAFLPGNKPQPALIKPLFVLLAAGLMWVFTLAPRRLAYTLTPSELVIRRMLGETRLPISGIKARKSGRHLAGRLFGTGLPGYLTGTFAFGPDEHGSVQAAASRGDHGVILEVEGRAYFVTPADPDAFLHELRQCGAAVSL